MRALCDIDIVVHASAMKQIVAAEYNPTECIATNILGALKYSLMHPLKMACKVVLSTDKAANPINLYENADARRCSDKLFRTANSLWSRQNTFWRCSLRR